MFIWDFVADTVLGQIIDWLYGQIIGFLGDFFMQMGNMGADLFTMSWVQSVVLFFSYLAWALYGVGLGEYDREFYPLSQFSLRDAEICEPEQEQGAQGLSM